MREFKEEEIKKARFFRKPESLDRMIERINTSPAQHLPEPEEYVIVDCYRLSHLDFLKTKNNLLMEEPFQRGDVGGHAEINGRYVRKVTKVYSEETGEYFLTDPQGFSYCRYVAIG